MIGRVQQPEMRDQTHMPFTMAVIHEVQRFADIVPLGLPHMTTRDIEVQGFLIPKVGQRAPLARAQHHLQPGSPSAANARGAGGPGPPICVSAELASPAWAGAGARAPARLARPFRAPRPLGKTN